jgi:hypothetical protein
MLHLMLDSFNKAKVPSQQAQMQQALFLRLMKAAVYVIDHLQVGFQNISWFIEASETLIVKQKDGSTQVSPSWRSLIGLECLQLIMANVDLP